MNTKTVDETLALWLDLETDGGLGADERVKLGQRVATGSDLSAERRRNEKLQALLVSSRIAVREDFSHDVMSALPTASWQRQTSSAWRVPLAMMLGLALAAVLVLGSVASDHPVLGTGLAVFDFAQSTVLAGSGIAVAAWRGAGMGLEELLAASSLNLIAFAALVICLDLLFLSLLRRRRLARSVVTAGEEESPQ